MASKKARKKFKGEYTMSTLVHYSVRNNSSSRANPADHAADIETTVQQVYPALHNIVLMKSLV